MKDKQNSDQQQAREGAEESRQDRRQDEVAKQRPAQQDQQVHDAHSRRPQRKDGSQDPG
ncbi:hypothetical protein [Stenotrophomonas cyclobalanopsidis]|uniref:hypothetical protein n=1 Tax=Stenotrophomonas cyclobalanopsidis TaxID=2771362 RepID=UPI0034601239